VTGSHTFKVGSLPATTKKNELSGGSLSGSPNYWGCSIGEARQATVLFDALDGSIQMGMRRATDQPVRPYPWHDYEVYAGDTWKLRRNVTLEYGARGLSFEIPSAPRTSSPVGSQALLTPLSRSGPMIYENGFPL